MKAGLEFVYLLLLCIWGYYIIDKSFSLIWIPHLMSEWPVNSMWENDWQLIGGCIFQPFVVLCRQNCIALGKIFSFLTLIQLSHFFTLVTLWVTHITVSHGLLKHWSLAFSVIEADFLPYFSSHFAVGSPLKTHGTCHLLSACDSLCRLLGIRSRFCQPCQQREVRQWAVSENAKANFR